MSNPKNHDPEIRGGPAKGKKRMSGSGYWSSDVGEVLERTGILLRRRPLARPLHALIGLAPDLIAQIYEIDELVGLAAQLVRHHRRARRERRDDTGALAFCLHRLDQRAEIAVAREQDDMIETVGELHHIDGKLD